MTHWPRKCFVPCAGQASGFTPTYHRTKYLTDQTSDSKNTTPCSPVGQRYGNMTGKNNNPTKGVNEPVRNSFERTGCPEFCRSRVTARSILPSSSSEQGSVASLLDEPFLPKRVDIKSSKHSFVKGPTSGIPDCIGLQEISSMRQLASAAENWPSPQCVWARIPSNRFSLNTLPVWNGHHLLVPESNLQRELLPEQHLKPPGYQGEE
mmetsp:Transcript_35086/g.45061  ORF Transcript_35086/g.45061 Transcript_35086/m.45061 type:complete len:207 (+) Transcript_35086:846-1466(+)